MFRNIRRKKKEINIDACKELLCSERRGVLAMNGVEGYPYAIPLNYRYLKDENRIIFHGARAGHKVEALKLNDKVCFTVYGHETIREEDWAPYMQSVVIFGRCKLITDEEEKLSKVRKLAEKYYPSEKEIDEEITSSGRNVQMFEISIEHMSGKEIQEK